MNFKILLISNMYPSKEHPTYGVFVKNFKNQMEKQGFIVTQEALIKGRGKNKFEKIVKYINFFREVIISVKQNQYDLIYVHYISHSLLPLLLVQKYIKKPLVLNAHGSDVFANSRIKEYIQNLVTPIIKKANTIVVPSSYFEDVIHNKFHIEKNKIFVSPSGGIDTDLFKPLKKAKDTSELIIGYVSRIDQGKGWDTLLHAVKFLLNKNADNLRVIIIGDGSRKPQLLNMIQSLKLEKHVKYLGKVSHKELPEYYNKMDIFAFTTTLNESLGLVGLEAMACGIPVVGSNIGGLKGYIKNEYNGELFEPGNAEDLAKSLKKFITLDKKTLQFYSTNALITAKQYDSKEVSKKMSKKLNEIINKDNKIAK